MKITQADIDRHAQPLADDFCRRLYDHNGDRVDNVTVLCYLDTERRYASLCAASLLVHMLPETPSALDFGRTADPGTYGKILVLAFAPSFDEEGARSFDEATFYTNGSTLSTFPFLKASATRSVEEMLRLSTLDWLADWTGCAYGFASFVDPSARSITPFSEEGMAEGRERDRLARKWASKGLPARVGVGGASVKASGLLRRTGRLCLCGSHPTQLDANPFEHVAGCERMTVRLRESAAMDPAELRRRLAPLAVTWLESRWPRWHFQRGPAWERWKEHMVLDEFRGDSSTPRTEASVRPTHRRAGSDFPFPDAPAPRA